MKVTRPAHLPSPLSTELFQTFEAVIAERYSGAVVLPSLLTGATDSAQLRAGGIASYGFCPGLVVGDHNRVHGNGEFLRISPFTEFLRLLS